MAACQAVLSTYELIEAILVEFPPFELITATQVCTAWRDLIRQSSRLPSMVAISSMQQSSLLPSMQDETMYPAGTTLRLHPLLPQRAEGKRNYLDFERTQQNLPTVPYRVYQFNFRDCKPRRRLRELERKQFVTLPPVTRITSPFLDFRKHGEREGKRVLERADGVRLGDIEPVVSSLVVSRCWISPTELRVLDGPSADDDEKER